MEGQGEARDRDTAVLYVLARPPMALEAWARPDRRRHRFLADGTLHPQAGTAVLRMVRDMPPAVFTTPAGTISCTILLRRRGVWIVWRLRATRDGVRRLRV